MAPASTHAPRADAEFDLDVRLTPVILAGLAQPPTDAGCPAPGTGGGSCADVSGCVPPVCFVPKRS